MYAAGPLPYADAHRNVKVRDCREFTSYIRDAGLACTPCLLQ